jgi:hypothetical protein
VALLIARRDSPGRSTSRLGPSPYRVGTRGRRDLNSRSRIAVPMPCQTWLLPQLEAILDREYRCCNIDHLVGRPTYWVERRTGRSM